MAEKEAKTAENEIEIRISPVRDGGFGWVVVAAAFVIQFIVLGLQNNVGIVFGALLDEFKKSKSETAWVGSIALGLMFMCGPFTSVLCEQLGCRVVGVLGGLLGVLGLFLSSFVKEIHKLYVTFGLLWGIGASFCYFPTLRILPCWFNRNLSSANGIVTAGSGVGTIAMGPIMQLLISQLGWFNAARVFGGTLAIVSLAAFFYRIPPQPENVKEVDDENTVKQKKPLLDWRVLQNKAYVIWIIALGVFMLGYWTPFVHLPRHAEEIGVSKAQASILVGIMSAGSTLGRLFFGKIADHPRVNRLYLYQVAMLSIGIADTLLPLVQNFFGLAVYMVTFGIFEGCYIVLMPVITGDIVGLDKLSAGIGVMFGFMSVLVFIGPPLSGWMYDVAGGYDVAFYVAGACSVVSTVILFLVPLAMLDYGTRNRSETAGSADSQKPLIGLSDSSSHSSDGDFHGDKTISTIEIEVTSPTDSKGHVVPRHLRERQQINRQSWRGSQMSYIDMYLDMPKRTSLRQAIAAQSMADLTNLMVQRTTTV